MTATSSQDVPERWGQAIRTHRKAAGLSQIELSRLAGVGKTAVFDIEKGKATVRLATLLRVLDALSLHLELRSRSSEDGHA
jgi:HTH-type transcriptional regulator / antitoxin HipB